MNRSDAIVNNLLNALDAIVRVADKPHQQPYIQGIAEQAIRNAHTEMTRNADGYLVVRETAVR